MGKRRKGYGLNSDFPDVNDFSILTLNTPSFFLILASDNLVDKIEAGTF